MTIHEVKVNINEETMVTDVVNPIVITYPQLLLSLAKELLDTKCLTEFARTPYGLSVISSHMACEVAAARSMREAHKNNGMSEKDISKELEEFFFSLKGKKSRTTFKKLTGYDVENAHFWTDYVISCDCRNDIIHNSKVVVELDAKKAIEVAEKFVAFLGQ